MPAAVALGQLASAMANETVRSAAQNTLAERPESNTMNCRKYARNYLAAFAYRFSWNLFARVVADVGASVSGQGSGRQSQ